MGSGLRNRHPSRSATPTRPPHRDSVESFNSVQSFDDPRPQGVEGFDSHGEDKGSPGSRCRAGLRDRRDQLRGATRIPSGCGAGPGIDGRPGTPGDRQSAAGRPAGRDVEQPHRGPSGVPGERQRGTARQDPGGELPAERPGYGPGRERAPDERPDSARRDGRVPGPRGTGGTAACGIAPTGARPLDPEPSRKTARRHAPGSGDAVTRTPAPDRPTVRR